jgi:hypothetical protein
MKIGHGKFVQMLAIGKEVNFCAIERPGECMELFDSENLEPHEIDNESDEKGQGNCIKKDGSQGSLVGPKRGVLEIESDE